MRPEDPQRPDDEDAKARIFGGASLAPVFELNRLFLDALVDASFRPASEVRPRLASALQRPLAQLTPAARDRLSRCPICFVDAGFRDDERWAAIATQSDARLGSQEIVFPPLQALQLAYQTLTLAWTIARASLEGACLIFGMTRKSARVIAKAGIQTMHQVAERHTGWVRPAWDDQSAIWQHLIAMALRETDSQSSLGLRALQRRLADLEPATGESNEIRSTLR